MTAIDIKWTKDELVTYISNLSAYVAQTLSLGGDVAFDVNTLTEDNKETFLNEKITEGVNSLVPYFARIVADDTVVINDTTDVGITFIPRIEGGDYSQAELSQIKTLSRKVVASYILADWYSVKGITAMSEYFTSQNTQSGVELYAVLDRFVRPVRKSAVTINRVTYNYSKKPNLVRVNNKSDFVLLWSTKNGEALPEGDYDIEFYTEEDGAIYTVNSLDTTYVKSVEGRNDAVRIVFDFSRSGVTNLENGVLKYWVNGNIPDEDFSDGFRYFESVGETNIEIWDGASDSDGELEASYIPAYKKLTFDDLTEEDIAVLQGPAIEAANTANVAASYATNQGDYAKEQGDYAKEKGAFAAEAGNQAMDYSYRALGASQSAMAATEEVRSKMTEYEQAEQLRESAFNGKIEEVDEAVALAQRQVATSVGEINTLIRETTTTLEEAETTLQDSQNKIEAVEAVIANANTATSEALSAARVAESKGDFAEQSAYRALQAMEGAQNAVESVNSSLARIDKSEGERVMAEVQREETFNAKMTAINDAVSEMLANAPYQEVTWSELVALRDGGLLMKGTQYRITDYVTTTKQSGISSAGHQFDLIVVADTNSTLNEVARACLHEGDTYFTEYGAKLESWQVWYCLDNDTTRFGWADSANGKGVIYRLIDEWGNDVPYDFKNILYAYDGDTIIVGELYGWETGEMIRNSSGDEASSSGVMYYAWDTPFSPDPALQRFYTLEKDINTDTLFYRSVGSTIPLSYVKIIGIQKDWVYTFNIGGIDDTLYSNKEGFTTFNNKVKPDISGQKQLLNNILFEKSCYSNSFAYSCHGMTLGEACYHNDFKNDCSGNRLGNKCSNNEFNHNSNNVALVDNVRYVYIKNVYSGGGAIFTPSVVANASYAQTVARNSSGEVVVYCEADLIQ